MAAFATQQKFSTLPSTNDYDTLHGASMKRTKATVSDFTSHKLFVLRDDTFNAAPEIQRWAPMHNSDALGVDVICDTSNATPFGLGWIKFPPHGEVKLHTHEGSHMLICFAGSGTVKVVAQESEKESRIVINELSTGECYNIPSMVPHSVHSGSDGLLLLVIGNDYRRAASEDRLQMVNE
jgi:quercetin dioxygenase-like cupin family protein